MRILFFCGSLEPGRDGVGDYTRRLAGEIKRQGHDATIVAINDNYVKYKFAGIQISEGMELLVLRVPAIWTLKKRSEDIKSWINEINPEWLSLQFVPFQFPLLDLIIAFASQLNYFLQSNAS